MLRKAKNALKSSFVLGLTAVWIFVPVLGGAAVSGSGLRLVEEFGEARNGVSEFRLDAFRSERPEFRKDAIIVRFRGDARPFSVMNVPAGRSVEDLIGELRSRQDVEYAEPDYIATAFLTPNDTYFEFQWHLDNPVYGGIHTKTAWDQNRGMGVDVAVVDTGVAYEDFGLSFKKAPDLAGTCFKPGYDFINNDTHPNDDNSHGTHVAGTIAQTTNNGLGVAGVAFESCVIPVKVLDRNGSGSYSAVANGIRFAADNGAKVINLSLGGSSPSLTLENAVKYAYEKGVVVVAAAGNSDSDSPSYPAAYDAYVISVGATRYDEKLAPYSNFGSSLDVVAPGGDTSVDQNGDGYGDGVLQNTFNPNTKNARDFGYWFFQGTSMATPHVVGLVALLISKGNAVTPDQVREAIQSTADDLGSVGRDNTYGWGLINAPAALAWTSAPVDNPPSVSITNPANGATVSGVVNITANASDDNGVSRVDFYVDAALIASDAVAPYETPWNSTTAAEGSHSINATAVDTASQNASATVNVTVNNINDPPVANAGPDRTVTDNDGNGVEAVTLDGSASSDPDGSIASYSWDFGDGTTGSGATLTHTYAVGPYTATLTVTDNGGLSSQDTALITVNAKPAEIEVFADSFESAGVSSKDETRGMSHNGSSATSFANWTQDSQNDWFRSTQRATNGSWSAEVDGFASDAKLISVAINLQGKTNATITFSWLIETGLDAGEYLAFDVSTDGGTTWTERSRLRGDVDPEDVWANVSADLNGISSLKLRFRAKMSGASEDANVDAIRVVAR